MLTDPSERIRALAAQQHSLITATQALSLGFTRYDIRTRIRRREWLTLTRGVFLTEAELYADGLPQETWWRAALLAHGPQACLVGSSAVQAFGIAGLPRTAEHIIEIAVPNGLSVRPRATRESVFADFGDGPIIRVRQLVVPSDEVVEANGFRVRTAAESLVDTGLNSSRPTALSILDSALHLGAVTRDELDWAVLRATGRRGVVALRRLAQIADGRAESPLESRVRLICVDAGIPPTDLQHVVRDEHGNVIAIGDMAWIYRQRRPLLAEADGAEVHSAPKAVFRDRVRGIADGDALRHPPVHVAGHETAGLGRWHGARGTRGRLSATVIMAFWLDAPGVSDHFAMITLIGGVGSWGGASRGRRRHSRRGRGA